MNSEIIKTLENKIKQFAESYYRGEAIITDAQFDSLVEELRKVDPDNTLLTKTGWGYEVKGDKIKHPLVSVHGLSKERVQPSDVIKFQNVTPKFDGANVELIYINGKFDKAISRGNGEYGQDITRHLKWLVPAELVQDGFSTNQQNNISVPIYNVLRNSMVSISGEFLLSKTSKEKYYKDEMAFRNIPAGFLNRKESTEEECKRFSFQPYRINAIKSNVKIAHKVLFELTDRYLIQCILNVWFGTEIPCCNIDDDLAKEYGVFDNTTYKQLIDFFDEFDFFYDGIVVNRSKRVSITPQPTDDGSSLYVFKYDEIAYKVNNDFADVIITSIDWNLTRTGKVVPVANFNAVELSGAMVSRATLHNAYMVEANQIQPGTLVRIIRSGEVIPYIMGIFKNGGYYEISLKH